MIIFHLPLQTAQKYFLIHPANLVYKVFPLSIVLTVSNLRRAYSTRLERAQILAKIIPAVTTNLWSAVKLSHCCDGIKNKKKLPIRQGGLSFLLVEGAYRFVSRAKIYEYISISMKKPFCGLLSFIKTVNNAIWYRDWVCTTRMLRAIWCVTICILTNLSFCFFTSISYFRTFISCTCEACTCPCNGTVAC